MAASTSEKDTSLADLVVNVVVPVVVLNFLSKEHRLGPLWALIVATGFPVGYGVWYGVARRKLNFFSALGFISILLTGVMGLARADAFWFAAKEAIIPVIFGVAILGSQGTGKPLLRAFLLRREFFDLRLIADKVAERGADAAYRRLEWRGAWMLAGSVFLSGVVNFVLALRLLSGKEDDPVAYNEAVGKLTGVGFLVVGLPMMAAMAFTVMFLVKRIARLTGLESNAFFLPDEKRTDAT